MEWLNYHHLLYFWMVAREGSLGAAGKRLRLSQPTLSGQIRKLEDTLGERLFERKGRGLALTDVGRVVYRYADEIFTIGNELIETVRRRPSGEALRLDVGIVDAVPKLLVRELLRPALELPQRVRLVVREEQLDRLLAALAAHELDVVISDAPLPPGGTVRAWDHVLGQSAMALVGVPELVNPRRKAFPASIDGAPLLLPVAGSALRRSLDAWFASLEVRPVVIAEAEDSALLKTLAGDGMGLVFVPSVLVDVVERRYGMGPAGTTDAVLERYYAITGERRLVHPAVRAIREAAQRALLAR
jgi:LysR family transcriptional activator of nhaA